ncbi:ATPase AAA [Skermanella stibiiresistens SB22]|uniref:ATPase AAA n=1 Tax=Skermanella stibiiresistens SB22 TaxID=1385369 RepID=W9H872_9PROT|nr:sigma-54 dependent transcriptional regulator [Skermanella stibiiresistens]EWY42450.1 ATPase AAA [Skermanella stibiiresistens SB22]
MATVLIVDDDTAFRESLAETIVDLGHVAATAATGREALSHLDGKRLVDAVLLDLRMPGELDGMAVLRRMRETPSPPPVVIVTAYASADNTIEAMRLGAFDHLTKPIGRDELARLLARIPFQDRAGRGADVCGGPPSAESGPPEFVQDGLIGSSEAMRRVQKIIGMAADSDATVLISGETGTGKEMVARALHEHSWRKGGPFVAVNCAAIPADLLESELFGHVRGAFTGAAVDRSGAFRDANRGTLFLDEIGDMPLAMQAKILRVLQDRIVTPLGGRAAAVDVRILAATNRDLPDQVAQGGFREDLYYRLNVVPIALAPLRERLADIVPLAEHFLALSAVGGIAKRLSAEAAARLLEHGWPGNARELRNTIERASVLVRGPVIEASDLGHLIAGPPASGERGAAVDWLAGDLPTAVARLEVAMIRRALDEANGNRAEAARRLGVQRQLLYAKMERHGLGSNGMGSHGPDSAGDLSAKTTPGVGKDDT